MGPNWSSATNALYGVDALTFKTLPVDIVGGTYQSRSLPLSAQTCINLYPESNPTGRTPKALHNFPGSKPFAAGGGGACRGSHDFNGTLYQVEDTTLYSVDNTGVRISIGTIAGTSQCIFSNDSANMMIVTGNEAYQYNGTTLSEITDVDLETPDSVSVLNNQAIYDGNNGRWVVATVGDPDDIPDINYAVAESNGDDLVRVYEFNQTLYLLGTKTIEPWFNSGSGSPPMTRIEGGIIKKGLFALHSVANTTEYVYLLDSDKKVSRLKGYQMDETITPPAIAHEIYKMDASDAKGFTMNIEGQNLYVLTFPTGNKTFMFSETFGTWSQLSFGVDGARHLMNSYQFIYGKRLITDYRNSNIYELDLDTFDDNGDVQIRERTTTPINGISLGLPATTLKMEWFEVFIETGVGIASGQGSDPEIMFSTSIDGGRTFDSAGAGYVLAGKSGEYLIRVRYDCVMDFQDIMIKMRCSDPVFMSIHGAAMSIEPQMGY